MSKKGLSVVIESKEEFEKLKDFLGEYLYFGWNPAYLEKPTAVVIHYEDEDFPPIGSIGCAKAQEEYGCRIVFYKQYFK